MDEEIKTWLFDILQSINEVESYFSEGTKSFELYKKDTKTKRAVERDLEIIGEAVNRILKKNPDYTLSNAQKIIALRNRIAHGYDTVSDELIWAIVINHLPKLKTEIEQKLSK